MAGTSLTAARRVLGRPVGALDSLGEQLLFYVKALAWTPRTIRRYKKEVLRLLAEVTFGTGALAVIGGTVVIIGFLTLSTGALIAVQGYNTLSNCVAVCRHITSSANRPAFLAISDLCQRLCAPF